MVLFLVRSIWILIHLLPLFRSDSETAVDPVASLSGLVCGILQGRLVVGGAVQSELVFHFGGLQLCWVSNVGWLFWNSEATLRG